jgi:hypothetical protein
MHAPRRLDLAEPVEVVPRIRPAEVDHLVRLEDLLVLRVHAVDVATDELVIVRDDLDVVRSQRPDLRRQA